MRNPDLEVFDVLLGEWSLILTDAWFLEPETFASTATPSFAGSVMHSSSFTAEMEGEPVWHFVFGRSDPNKQLIALYHDPRPTSRVFRMAFGNGEWTLLREDLDFHQRFVATVTDDRIHGRWDASEDAGATWRKDFDLIFERTRHRRHHADAPTLEPSNVRVLPATRTRKATVVASCIALVWSSSDVIRSAVLIQLSCQWR